MALWLFRRKSRRKRTRSNTLDSEESRGRPIEPALHQRSQTAPDAAMAMLAPALERQGTKKQRTEPNKLQRRVRPYSFSPDRQDSIWVRRTKSTRANAAPANNSGPLSSGDEEMMWRIPTLHNKRDGDDLSRKKSSKKRRKHDHQREAEIKAMSAFVPVRPAAEDWTAGRPMRRDTKKVKTGLGFSFKGSDWEKHNRSSDISLPVPESIDSALSSDSDFISFKVSALEALAPRPTLRCTTHSPSDGVLFRRPSQRERKSPSAPIPEETLKAHKRIANLADDLTASDLRELMERDKRRRERKRQREQEKIEQKLARRAEKQKAIDVAAQEQGRESPPNLERGVFGRESIGLAVEPASVVVTTSRPRNSDQAIEQQDHTEKPVESDPRPRPVDAFHRVDSIIQEIPLTTSEAKQQVGSILSSPRSRSSFLRGKARRSRSPRESITRTEQSESLRKGSETSSSRGPLSWASFFRWGVRNKHSSEGPSSFSNTSRDSMHTTPQVPTPPATLMPRRLSSGVPKRTMSRFREDLPDFPRSPPESRLQSPEVDPIPPIIETSPDVPSAQDDAEAAPPPIPGETPDTPVYDHNALEAMRDTPSTFSHPDEQGPSPEPQSMSLASIDSEASWFSGKAAKKRKTSGVVRRLTPESDNERIDEVDNYMSIAEDDYLSRLTPSKADRSSWNRKSNGEPRASSDWEEEAHWGTVQGQQPTVVHAHGADRMKSREGLLHSYREQGEEKTAEFEAGESTDGGSPVDVGPGVQRATSVNLGKGNARRVSAGSVRLLSISPRSSVDTKRASLASASASRSEIL
ncbi:hypothetical protein QBC38DRAFT_39923 [Podospora fimiseda]|uniref:Uncharacterized protein n=1 Tax=Podospora fimiseda TaxID=252190 RepID=A0AAN7BVF2_9PEZI|nr:hypothetical protein QBC38DRAFT_39923 [Podospora fimiseda]